MSAAAWHVEEVVLDVADAHAADLTGPGATRLLRVHAIERPTLVLGSTQSEDHVDLDAVARADVDVVRRRSGGGAVLLAPDDVVWLDVVVPAGDPRWSDDVAVAFEWLGEAWVHAFAAVGVAGAATHRGSLVRTQWSDRVCFAGLGPGEVTLWGAKVVGISQRRTRHAARFQCAVLRRWDVAGIAPLVGLGADAVTAMGPLATGIDTAPDALIAALLTVL